MTSSFPCGRQLPSASKVSQLGDEFPAILAQNPPVSGKEPQSFSVSMSSQNRLCMFSSWGHEFLSYRLAKKTNPFPLPKNFKCQGIWEEVSRGPSSSDLFLMLAPGEAEMPSPHPPLNCMPYPLKYCILMVASFHTRILPRVLGHYRPVLCRPDQTSQAAPITSNPVPQCY